MKAILTFTDYEGEKPVEQTRLFDTSKARKICDILNDFNRPMQEIYITGKGTLFIYDKKHETIEVADQRKAKEWIGRNEPDKYIKFFGKVEEG